MTLVEQTKLDAIVTGPAPLERRGRRWIFGSFALCPCHLPLTPGILVTLLGGAAAGAVLRDHVVLAGAAMTTACIAGTWRGFRLVRLAQQGACPVREQPGVTVDGDADPRRLRSC